MWYDERNGGGIYAQNIHDDGTLGLTTNIEQLSGVKEVIHIYPNPSEKLNLYIKENIIESGSVKITDLSGRMVFQKMLNGISQNGTVGLDIVCAKGVYLVNVEINSYYYQILWLKE